MNSDNNSGLQLPAAAITALQMGNMIEAIRIVRRETGLGLKDAKDLVDAYVARYPEVQELLRSKSKGGALGWIVMLLLAIAAVVYFFPR